MTHSSGYVAINFSEYLSGNNYEVVRAAVFFDEILFRYNFILDPATHFIASSPRYDIQIAQLKETTF